MKTERRAGEPGTFLENSPVRRPHLIEKMESVLNRGNLFLTGPAGSGKSTLIHSFLKERQTPALRVRVGSNHFDDTDLSAALKQQFFQEYRESISFPDKNSIKYIDDYFENIFSSKNKEFLIIIDNLEKIEDSSIIHDLIKSGIEKKSQNTKFILISRKNLPDTFIRNIAHSDIFTIGYEDLKFSKKELKNIFSTTLENNSSLKIDTIDSFLKGWITGYTLLAQKVINEKFDLSNIDHLNVKEIHSYLEYEVFQNIPDKIQSFLKKICIPEKIDIPLATSLSGDSDAEKHLEYLVENNNFISKKYTEGKTYTLHPCFKSFIFAKRKKETSKEDFTLQLRNTSALLSYSGGREEAYELLIENSDWEGASQILEANAESIIREQGEVQYLQLLAQIPEEITREKNWIKYWEAVCLQKTDPASSIELQKFVLESFESVKEISGMYLSWSRLVESLIYMNSGSEPLEEMLAVYERLSRKNPEYPTHEVRKTCISALMSILCLLKPESKEIDKNPPDIILPLSSDISHIYAFLYGIRLIILGKFERAALYKDNIAKEIKIDIFNNIATSLNIFLQKYKSDYSEIIESTLFENINIENSFIYSWAKLQKIDSLIALHKADDALLEIESLNKNIGNNVFLRCALYIIKTKLSLSLHNTDQADLFLEIAEELSQSLHIPFINFEIQTIKSYIRHIQNLYPDSINHIKEAEKIAKDTGSKLFTYQINILKYHLFNEEKHISKASALGGKFGYVDAIFKNSDYLLDICSRSLQNDKTNSHIKTIIKKNKLLPEGPALHLENWPWPLKIYTLGRFSVVINGKTIKFSRRAQQKPLSMLKVIIALGGRKIREDLISDALWPDADGDIAHQSFATTLHRLRKLIGHHETIEVQNKLVSLNAKMCWVDSWVFERICGEADEAWSRGNKFHQGAARKTQEGIALYHGAFLASENWRPWILPLREKLQSKFIRCIKNNAAYCESRKQWNEAITYYVKGLEINNLSEDLYCGLMNCYQKTNLFSEAITTYNRCKKSLNTELEIDPSPKTTSLWKIIQRQSSAHTH